jgi:hypothetical protein
MKKIKANKESHVPNTKLGMGDYYGSGIRQKVGRVRDSFEDTPIGSKKLGKAPKSLA